MNVPYPSLIMGADLGVTCTESDLLLPCQIDLWSYLLWFLPTPSLFHSGQNFAFDAKITPACFGADCWLVNQNGARHLHQQLLNYSYFSQWS
jgi:hypothetical protein